MRAIMRAASGGATSAARSSANLSSLRGGGPAVSVRRGHTMTSIENFATRWADKPDVRRSAGRAFTMVNGNVQEIPHQADRERPSSMAQNLALRRIQRANQRAGRRNSMVIYRHGSITPLTHPGKGEAAAEGPVNLSADTSPHLRDFVELSQQSGLSGIAVMAPVAPRDYLTAHLPGDLNEKPNLVQAALLQHAQRMKMHTHAVGHSWGAAETANVLSKLPEDVQRNATLHFAGGATTRQEELGESLAGLQSDIHLYKGAWDPVTHFGAAYGFASGKPVIDRPGVELHRTEGGHGFGSSYLSKVSEEIRKREESKKTGERD